jgi:hypothetical protein
MIFYFLMKFVLMGALCHCLFCVTCGKLYVGVTHVDCKIKVCERGLVSERRISSGDYFLSKGRRGQVGCGEEVQEKRVDCHSENLRRLLKGLDFHGGYF